MKYKVYTIVIGALITNSFSLDGASDTTKGPRKVPLLRRAVTPGKTISDLPRSYEVMHDFEETLSKKIVKDVNTSIISNFYIKKMEEYYRMRYLRGVERCIDFNKALSTLSEDEVFDFLNSLNDLNKILLDDKSKISMNSAFDLYKVLLDGDNKNGLFHFSLFSSMLNDYEDFHLEILLEIGLNNWKELFNILKRTNSGCQRSDIIFAFFILNKKNYSWFFDFLKNNKDYFLYVPVSKFLEVFPNNIKNIQSDKDSLESVIQVIKGLHTQYYDEKSTFPKDLVLADINQMNAQNEAEINRKALLAYNQFKEDYKRSFVEAAQSYADRHPEINRCMGSVHMRQ